MKISGPEKGVLALTLICLVLCVGYFFRNQGGSEPYTVSAQTAWTSQVGAAVTGDTAAVPSPAASSPAAAPALTDDLLPTDSGEVEAAGEGSAETDPVEITPTGEVTAEPKATTKTGKVNINTATSEELQTLSGIGEVRAAAIIADREANGPFRIPEDITRVSGIGDGILAKIQDYITVE